MPTKNQFGDIQASTDKRRVSTERKINFESGRKNFELRQELNETVGMRCSAQKPATVLKRVGFAVRKY